MKTKLKIAGAILLILASTINAIFIAGVAAHTWDDPYVTDLVAGGGNPKSAIYVGEVHIWNDGDFLYVKYLITDPDWCIVETHLHVATTLEGIPQKNGNPIPGHFDYGNEHDCVPEFTYAVPLIWPVDTELYIAAHAVVNKIGCDPLCVVSETAWGDDFEFPGRNWATYIRYKVQEPGDEKIWSLPESLTFMITALPNPDGTFFEVEIVDCEPGHNIFEGTWSGWCGDIRLKLPEFNVLYIATVYSSYDPDLPPEYSDDEQWDYINYILNHKHPDASYYDIQQAIWYFADAGYPMPADPEAVSMILDAQANGAGFTPGSGQWGAVLLVVEDHPELQLVFIEVDP